MDAQDMDALGGAKNKPSDTTMYQTKVFSLKSDDKVEYKSRSKNFITELHRYKEGIISNITRVGFHNKRIL